MSGTEQIAEMFKQYVMPTYAPSIALVKGQGTRVWDADGKVYLDFGAGISVVNVGHSHPHVVEAISRQAAELTHVSNLYYTENQGVLARKLAELSLGGKSFFCNSGAEANEGLIKLARLWGHADGRYEIVCMKNSFHGRTLGTAAATGQEKVRKGFEPMPEGFVHAEFNNIESVAALVNEKTVAVLLEAVQGEGGVVPATPDFLKGVRELCNDRNLLMLCDEVQCGMGRTGSWFGFQTIGVQPDAFSLAKALGNGYPIGAVVGGPKVADTFQPGKHASTFGGTPLACAAALATIEVIEEEKLVERVHRKGAEIKDELRALVDRYEHVVDVRGHGFMLGLVLDQPVAELVADMADIGLLTLATAGSVVRLLPPLNAKDGEIEEALEIMDECLAAMQAGESAASTADSAADEGAAVEAEANTAEAEAEPESAAGEQPPADVEAAPSADASAEDGAPRSEGASS